MTANELLPCPFCGAEPLVENICDQVFVSCPTVHLEPIVHSCGALQMGIDRWNRRAPLTRAALAASPLVQEIVAEAVRAVTGDGGWNPRYVAYARDNGRGPASQLEHDTRSPSGMMPFVRWIDRCIAIFKAQKPEAFSGGYLKDSAAFDEWLSNLSVPAFATDNDDLLRRADIMVGMLRMGEKIAFGSDADMIADLAAAIRARGEGQPQEKGE